MNCDEFRRAVGAEPDTTDLAVFEHAAGCAECARYREEMRAMNGLIHKALTVDVAAPAVRTSKRRPSPMNWRIAAMLLVSLAVFSLAWLAYPRQTLAQDIVAHVVHEAAAMERTVEVVDATTVRDVLGRSGIRLTPNDMKVSFAMICPVRGREAPHLVVQTERGPVTVLVLTDEKNIAKPQRFEEQGFVGTLVPAPRGVIAVLADDGAVDEVARTVLAVLQY
jgi:hypothetical protein